MVDLQEAVFLACRHYENRVKSVKSKKKKAIEAEKELSVKALLLHRMIKLADLERKYQDFKKYMDELDVEEIKEGIEENE